MRLRTGLTDHNAEAVPHSRRHPSSIVAMVRAEFRLLRPADSTKPAAHSPAAEMSAAAPRGSTTSSGKNSRAAVSRPASDHAAMRWAKRFRKNAKGCDCEPSARAAGDMPPGKDTG